MEIAESSTGRGGHGMLGFPGAAQPEVMRAAEKDEHYVASLSDACHEAFRHALGTRLAVAYQNETKLAGRVLYYLLTTGAGLQTLGEEYCDISQVVVSSKLPATPARRTLLVFYQTVLPYLMERLSSRAAARGMTLTNQEELRGSSSGNNRRGATPHIVEEDGNMSRRHNQIQVWSQRVQLSYSSALQWWPTVLPSVREALLLVMRAHLMVFYFEGTTTILTSRNETKPPVYKVQSYGLGIQFEGTRKDVPGGINIFVGVYYHLAKRFAGMRYIFMGKPAQQRPRYHMLGMFLLIQLSIVGGDWLRRSVLPALAVSMRSRMTDPSYATSGRQGIALLDADGNTNVKEIKASGTEWLSTTTVGDPEGGRSKCPLCLSPRQHPTATPCGHVFCWNCVAEWCNEKPECPLCRAPVTHPQLVCIYHADF